MPKGRKTIEFDLAVLQSCINKIEQEESLSSRDELYKRAVRQYNQLGGLNANKLTPILIYTRVKKGGLTVKTPQGKRGAGLGKGGHPSHSPANPSAETVEHFKILKKYVLSQGYGIVGMKNTPAHTRIYRMVERAERGSLRAKINLKYLDCANYQREEIRNCQCMDCPLFSVRPYQ